MRWYSGVLLFLTLEHEVEDALVYRCVRIPYLRTDDSIGIQVCSYS